MLLKNLFVVSSLILVFSGCASGPKITTFEPQSVEGKAVIYHFRTLNMLGARRQCHVTNNQIPLATITVNSFYREVVEPGTHVYHALSQARKLLGIGHVSNFFVDYEERIKFSTEAGGVYYVDWEYCGAKLVDESEAKPKIIGLEDLTNNVAQ